VECCTQYYSLIYDVLHDKIIYFTMMYYLVKLMTAYCEVASGNTGNWNEQCLVRNLWKWNEEWVELLLSTVTVEYWSVSCDATDTKQHSHGDIVISIISYNLFSIGIQYTYYIWIHAIHLYNNYYECRLRGIFMMLGMLCILPVVLHCQCCWV